MFWVFFSSFGRESFIFIFVCRWTLFTFLSYGEALFDIVLFPFANFWVILFSFTKPCSQISVIYFLISFLSKTIFLFPYFKQFFFILLYTFIFLLLIFYFYFLTWFKNFNYFCRNSFGKLSFIFCCLFSSPTPFKV